MEELSLLWGLGGKQEVNNTTEICKHNIVGLCTRDFDLPWVSPGMLHRRHEVGEPLWMGRIS